MLKKLPESKTVKVEAARDHLGKLLNRVNNGEEHLVFEKLGMPIAIAISLSDYEEYKRLLSLYPCGARQESFVNSQAA